MSGLAVAAVTATTALVIGLGSPKVVIPLLRRRQVLDIPSIRSMHDVPTVRGVGVATAAAVLAAGIVAGLIGAPPTVALVLLSAVVLAVIGCIEDVGGLSIARRLLLQALLAATGAVALFTLTGAPDSQIAGPVVLLTQALSALAIVGYLNATNFMDGIDAISGLHGIAAGMGYALAGVLYQAPALLVTGTVTAAAFAGFLPWNLGPRRVFLGDSGSYLLGALVAFQALLAWRTGLPLLVATAPMIVYLVDTSTTLLRRAQRRERLWAAHSDHVFQQLIRQGLGHIQVAVMVTVATLSCVAVSLLSSGSWVGAAGVTAIGVLYLASPRLLAPRLAAAR